MRQDHRSLLHDASELLELAHGEANVPASRQLIASARRCVLRVLDEDKEDAEKEAKRVARVP